VAVGELAEALDVELLDATSLLGGGEHMSWRRVWAWRAVRRTCSQSAMCEFSWPTCFMRSLRTLTAWGGDREVWAVGEQQRRGSGARRGAEAAHEQSWVLFALELHDECGVARTASVLWWVLGARCRVLGAGSSGQFGVVGAEARGVSCSHGRRG
jgi:hypothetical protein